MDDREVFIRSIANFWAFNRLFIGRLLLALKKDGALSDETIQELLREADEDAQLLEGEDDRACATELLAGVRATIASASRRSGPTRASGDG